MRIYPFFLPHAGCPHRCRFCRQEAVSGGGSAPDPAAVASQLDRILPASGDGEVAFYGGTFTLQPQGVQRAYLETVAPFRRAGRVAGVRISTRPDALESPCVDLLARFGVSTVEIGCQSFSEEVLRRSGRGHGSAEAASAMCRLRSAGMRVGLQLMPGLPGSSAEEARLSLKTALGLAPDFLRIYPAVVLRGTALEKDWREGLYDPLSLEAAVDLCAELLWRCRAAAVPVIRMGLQSEPGLDTAGEALAGPYHPAFGQLVRSRLWLQALRAGVQRTGSQRVAVHPADLSDALGHHAGNRALLQDLYGGFSLCAEPSLGRDSLQFPGSETFTLDELAHFPR